VSYSQWKSCFYTIFCTSFTRCEKWSIPAKIFLVDIRVIPSTPTTILAGLSSFVWRVSNLRS